MAVETGQDALQATQATAEAARDAIAEARAKRDELFVLASHDMKNVVGILDSALGMLEEMPDAAAEMHGMMRRATHRLGILVRALVDVDLLERDLMPLAPAETAWGRLATTAVEEAGGAAATKAIVLELRGDRDARLACDAALVEKMLAALLEHAVASGPAGSTVALEGAPADAGGFRIRVVQAGRAVGAAALDKFFTTLPLRFCRLAAVRHGGALRAVSPVADGQGLAFELELPA